MKWISDPGLNWNTTLNMDWVEKEEIKNHLKKTIETLENQDRIKVLLATVLGGRQIGIERKGSDYDWGIVFFDEHGQEDFEFNAETEDICRRSIRNLFNNTESYIQYYIDNYEKKDFKPDMNGLISYYMPFNYFRNNVICRKGFQPEGSQATFELFKPRIALDLFENLALHNRYIGKQSDENRLCLKNYLFSLRAVLCGIWILEKKTMPPTDLQSLITVEKDTSFADFLITKIAEYKETTWVMDPPGIDPKWIGHRASPIIDPIEEFDEYITNGVKRISKEKNDVLLNKYPLKVSERIENLARECSSCDEMIYYSDLAG